MATKFNTNIINNAYNKRNHKFGRGFCPLKVCLSELHGRNLEPGAVLANFGDPTDLTHFALELWQMADVTQLAVNHRLAL